MNHSQFRYRHFHAHQSQQDTPSSPPTQQQQQQHQPLQQKQHSNDGVMLAPSSSSTTPPPAALACHQMCSSTTITDETENMDNVSEQSDLPPQILFLIKEHAKAVCDIRSINRRLKDLETKVESIYNVVRSGCNSNNNNGNANNNNYNNGDICNSSELKVKSEETGNVPNVLSDDSGGEYSRTTTGTAIDEDELLSLLEQIAKCSNQIKQTHQNQHYQSQLLTNSLINRSYQSYQQPQQLQLHSHLQPSTLQLHQHLSSSVNSIPGFYSSTSLNQQSLSNINNNSNLHRQLSVSALFFDPDVDRFLNSVNQLVDDQNQQRHSMNNDFQENHSGELLATQANLEKSKRIRQFANLREQQEFNLQAAHKKQITDDWPLVANCNNREQRLHLQAMQQKQQQQRPQLQQQQFPQHSIIQAPSLACVNNYVENAGDTFNQSMEKIKRARQLVNLREQEGLQSQRKLTDDWLASYAKERLNVVKQTQQQQQQQRSSSVQHLAASATSSSTQQQQQQQHTHIPSLLLQKKK